MFFIAGLRQFILSSLSGEKVSSTRASFFANKNHFGVPDPIEIAKIKSLLQESVKPGDHVLVLGATAELRSIALELGCKVASVDISLDMINAREQNVTIKDAARDVVIRGNWFDMWFLKENSFKAILADASFGNVLPEKHEQLMDVCKTFLQDGGVLIFRHFSEYTGFSLSELVQQYKDKEITQREMILCLFFHRGLPRAWNKKVVSVRESFRSILTILKKEKVDKSLIKYVEGYDWDAPYTITKQEEFDQLLAANFSKVEKLSTKKLLHSMAGPIYRCKT